LIEIDQTVNNPAPLDSGDPWWNTDWQYRKEITVNHSKVADDLTNFPILFDNTSSDFLHAQDDGDDFLFVSADNNTQYNHEIESYNESGNNRLIAWVNITTLSADSDTILYLYYGNVGAASQEDSFGTWDSNFVAVWHMDNPDNDTGLDDSTDSNWYMSEPIEGGGTETSCIIGYGQTFDQTNSEHYERLHTPDHWCIDLTMTIWWSVSPPASGDDRHTLIARDSVFGDWALTENYGGVDERIYWGYSGGYTNENYPLNPAPDIWYFSGITRDDTGEDICWYLDGSLIATDVYTLNVVTGSDGDAAITIAAGESLGAVGNPHDGGIDEIRISDIVRNASWIGAEYNTSKNPTTFLTVGAEQEEEVVGNNAPVLSVPYPVNGATDISLIPVLSVLVNDSQGDQMDVFFRTNASTGVWHTIGENLSVGNGTYNCDNTSEMNSYNTVYWWCVNVSDAGGNWTNATYHFTTIELLSNWGYRELLTINHTKVAGDLTDFPVLVDITHPGLQAYAQADGDDILFTNGSSQWTDNADVKLSHEIELYNNSTGHLVAWVKVPVLSSTADTSLYMYYGNPNCSSQENINGAWDSQYKMVQHLNETSGTHYDSTSFGNDGLPSVTLQGSAVGKVDGADRWLR